MSADRRAILPALGCRTFLLVLALRHFLLHRTMIIAQLRNIVCQQEARVNSVFFITQVLSCSDKESSQVAGVDVVVLIIQAEIPPFGDGVSGKLIEWNSLQHKGGLLF